VAVLLRANQTFCDMVGYSKTELEQRTFQEITHPDDVGPDMQLLHGDTGRPSIQLHPGEALPPQEGHTVWVQLTVALVRTARRQPDYFISVVQDLSAKAAKRPAHQPERLMNQAQKLASIGHLAGRPDHRPVRHAGQLARVPGPARFPPPTCRLRTCWR
jgi:PAS domain S-box-containing protein